VLPLLSCRAELVDEAVKVKEVSSQFKKDGSNHLDDGDNPGGCAWLVRACSSLRLSSIWHYDEQDQVLQLLVECCLHGFRPEATVGDQFDRVSQLMREPSPSNHTPRHMLTIVKLWFEIEKYALYPVHEKDQCYHAVSSAVASAVLHMKLMDETPKNNPHFALTVVALNEMNDATSKCHGASPTKSQTPLPKYDASICPSKPTQQLEAVLVVRLALLSVVLMAYKDHSRRHLPQALVSYLTLCTAHLLLLTLEIPLAMDYACLTTKIAAYLTRDDIVLERAKAVLCQAQTDLQSLHEVDKDWAEFDEHERSQRMFSVDWTAERRPLTATDGRQHEIISPETEGNPVQVRDDGGASDDSSDWDADDDVKKTSSGPAKGGAGLQHPSVSASSLSTVLNLRDLFVPTKQAKTTSWHMMLTQVMQHPPLDTAPRLPPPSSPYSRSFAAFETSHVLNNSWQSTRSMDQWLRDLACLPANDDDNTRSILCLNTPDAIVAHLHSTTSKYTQEWLDRYDVVCRRAAASAPAICLQLVQSFFTDIATALKCERNTSATWTSAASPQLLDAGLRWCCLVAEGNAPSPIVNEFLAVLRALTGSQTPAFASFGMLGNLRCALVEIEVRVHYSLMSEDDFMDPSSSWQALFDALRDASTRLHAHEVACRAGMTTQHDDEAIVSDILELSMHVLVIAHALWSGISPLSLKRVAKIPLLPPASPDADVAELDKLVGVAEILDHFADRPLAVSPGATWRRLKLLYPLLPLTSRTRVRAGMIMGMSLWATSQQHVHDAESILYESIYVLHTHFSLHSSEGISALTMFGDALLAVDKYAFATAAFETACEIAHRLDATACAIELERKLAVLCSDHGDVDRSIRYYKQIRARSLAQHVWFEYVYVTVTMACLFMDTGEYAAAAHDIQSVLQQMQHLTTYDSDVVAELHVLSIRLSICHLKLHRPHHAISALELCIQRFQPKAAKHAVILMWLAICYYKANQLPHCQATLKAVARLRKRDKEGHGSTSVHHGGSFAKLPPPFKYSIPVETLPHASMAADLYPVHAKVALKLNDFERAAHFSALSIVYLELQPMSATVLTQLAHVYYLRGKVLDAAANAPWLFPMKLQSLECEQLLPTQPTRSLHRRKSAVLVRDRVLMSLDECMYHSLRAFHHSYELYSSDDDKVGRMKAACRLAAVYLHKAFLPRLVLRRPLDQLMKFSLTRRQNATASSQDIKASAAACTVDFEFSLTDIENPTRFVCESSAVAMAPQLYVDACLNMCQLHCLRDKGADALGYWYEARDVFLNCVLCPSASSMQRCLRRLVITLLTFESSVVNENVVLLDLLTTPWPLWQDASCLKHTGRRACDMDPETSTTYQTKLREKPPALHGAGGHQRHKSDTLELLATKRLHVGGSTQPLATSRASDTTRMAPPLQDGGVKAMKSAACRPVQGATTLETIHSSFAMLKHLQSTFAMHQDDDSNAKRRLVMRHIWDHMDEFRGNCSLPLWLSSVGYDNTSMATVVYALEIIPASILATYVPSSGRIEWKWIDPPNQLTLLSATGFAQPPPLSPLRRFHIDESKALPAPLSAAVLPELFTISGGGDIKQHARNRCMFRREFSSRLTLVDATDSMANSDGPPQNDANRGVSNSCATTQYSLVCSAALQSLPWEYLRGASIVRRPTAFVTNKAPSPLDQRPVHFRICRIKTRYLHSTEVLSPWWSVLGYAATVSLTQKKGKFSKKVAVVEKTSGPGQSASNSRGADLVPVVDIVLASLLELNGATSWICPSPTRLYVLAPPQVLPVLSKAMLASLPQLKKPSLFAKRRAQPSVVTAASVLECVHRVVQSFQTQYDVPVVVYSSHPW
ncbi:hypothetical protein DYB32_008324, partial [Aphanomyces invadans]